MLDGHLLHPPDVSVLPPAERAAVARALAKDPLARWPNCRAFVAALAGGSPAGKGTLVHVAPSPTAEMPLPLPTDEPDLPLPLVSMELSRPPGLAEALTRATPTAEFHPVAANPEPRLTLDSDVAPRKPEVSTPSASHYGLAAEDTVPPLRPSPPPHYAEEEDEETDDAPPAGLLGSVIAVADTVVAVLRFGLDSLLALPPRVVGAFLALLVTVVLVLACVSLRLFIR
jgi:hypothetical protein